MPKQVPQHERATVWLTIRLTPDQRSALKRAAHDNRTSLTGFVREAVNEAVADYGERRPFRATERSSGANLGE